jgi:hypothetical protein
MGEPLAPRKRDDGGTAPVTVARGEADAEDEPDDFLEATRGSAGLTPGGVGYNPEEAAVSGWPMPRVLPSPGVAWAADATENGGVAEGWFEIRGGVSAEGAGDATAGGEKGAACGEERKTWPATSPAAISAPPARTVGSPRREGAEGRSSRPTEGSSVTLPLR